MRKILVFTLILVLSISGSGLMACAPAPAELQPVKVELVGIPTLSAAEKYVDLIPTFSVTNANKVPVTLTSLAYVLYVESQEIGRGEIPDKVYIPAETQVRVATVISAAWSGLWLQKYFGGKQPPAAMAEALPFWKKLGGALPSEPLKAVWEGLSGPPATYEVKGTARIVGGGIWAETPISAKLTK